jgi:hypothetical protein
LLPALNCLLLPFGGARNDRKIGATLSITRNAALIEVAPRYELCRSTDNDKAFTSSASAGIGSRFLLSSSHSVSWLGICSRFARLRSSSEVGDWKSCEWGEVFEPEGDVFVRAPWEPGRSMREMSSCRESGSRDCSSRLGYNRLRIVRHSSRDWDSASRVLHFL